MGSLEQRPRLVPVPGLELGDGIGDDRVILRPLGARGARENETQRSYQKKNRRRWCDEPRYSAGYQSTI
jgi:hypothetical protein